MFFQVFIFMVAVFILVAYLLGDLKDKHDWKIVIALAIAGSAIYSVVYMLTH